MPEGKRKITKMRFSLVSFYQNVSFPTILNQNFDNFLKMSHETRAKKS